MPNELLSVWTYFFRENRDTRPASSKSTTCMRSLLFYYNERHESSMIGIKIKKSGHAQGKLGIWTLTFPDREKTENLVNLILTQGNFFENVAIKVVTR